MLDKRACSGPRRSKPTTFQVRELLVLRQQDFACVQVHRFFGHLRRNMYLYMLLRTAASDFFRRNPGSTAELL